jgi:hypothetical protein
MQDIRPIPIIPNIINKRINIKDNTLEAEIMHRPDALIKILTSGGRKPGNIKRVRIDNLHASLPVGNRNMGIDNTRV